MIFHYFISSRVFQKQQLGSNLIVAIQSWCSVTRGLKQAFRNVPRTTSSYSHAFQPTPSREQHENNNIFTLIPSLSTEDTSHKEHAGSLPE
ncbi:hypothetical protein LENED_006919 [Lentinula edodes]|uniref:Uncharacterized protein n=1 Tax=Lentinula edodes TaxID=5353 RepID=A0A1Q3ED74_LENED|nr:hypothetical protein LENED_006919 [Lentinula edodes]